MALWRQITRGFRGLLHRTRADRDIADEVEHYFEEAASALESAGLSPEEARRAARRELGQVTAVQERVRAYGWEHGVDNVAADVRYGLRQLYRRPAFALVAVLTLAIGIGASTTIFSVVNPVLLQPLPYPDAGRLMTIWDGEKGTRGVTFGTYREVLARTRTFASLAAMHSFQVTLSGVAEPERLDGEYVSANYFRVLGVPPALGRDFDVADDQPRAPFVVLISDGLWRRRFSADPTVVGRQILLEGDVPVTVIGVLPATFENVLRPSAEIWSPLEYDTALPINGREWGHNLRVVGRLRDGVELEQAKRDLAAIARTPIAEFRRPSWASIPDGLIAIPLQDDLSSGVRPALLAVLGAVALLMTIVCVNVTSLILARGAERRPELRVRAALGASRMRLVRQLTAETMLLAIIGGVVGTAFAYGAMDVVVAISPLELPRATAITVNGWVLMFTVMLSGVIGLGVGIVPALRGSRTDLRTGVHESSTTLVGRDVTRRTLVVVQVALALVLLVGAGLLLRSVQRLFAVPPGFDATNLLTLQVHSAGRQFSDPNVTNQFFAQVVEAVRRVPGVSAAALTTQLPLTGDTELWGVAFESVPSVAPNENPDAYRYAVAPGYFEAMRIPLRRGRPLNERDEVNAPRVAVVSESLARRRLPGLDPIGQRLRIGAGREWFTIVGVVGDVQQTSLAVGRTEAVYVTNPQWAQFADRARWLVVRAQTDPAALTTAIRGAIGSIDKKQPIVRVATMAERVKASASIRRFALVLFEAFGVVALVLAAIGTYSLLSGSVSQRLRELAVRTALGADRTSLLALVLRQGMSLTVAGILTGLAAAILASRYLETMLFGVSRLDAVTYAGVVVLLAVTSFIACWLPASKATRLDPNVVLRTD